MEAGRGRVLAIPRHADRLKPPQPPAPAPVVGAAAGAAVGAAGGGAVAATAADAGAGLGVIISGGALVGRYGLNGGTSVFAVSLSDDVGSSDELMGKGRR